MVLCCAIVLAPSLANRDASLERDVRSGEQVHWEPREVQRLMRSLDEIPDVSQAAELAQVVHSECSKLALDPLYAIAVMKVESNFRADAVSPRGAVGLMQVRSDAARSVGRVGRERSVNVRALADPRTNVSVGLRYLQRLEREFDDRATALAAYNCGPSRVRRTLARGRRLPRVYADRVLSTYAALRRPDDG
jgi:hypothetical protein